MSENEHRSTDEIARLFEVAGREVEAINGPAGCVALLHEAQQAKAALGALSAAELRGALEYRRRQLRGEPA